MNIILTYGLWYQTFYIVTSRVMCMCIKQNTTIMQKDRYRPYICIYGDIEISLLYLYDYMMYYTYI